MVQIAPLVPLGLGMMAVFLFQADIYLPIWLSVLIFVAVSLFFIHRYNTKRAGLLLLLFWAFYVLPFIHIPPYLWFDFSSEAPLRLWGLALNPYMLDEKIIALTAMLGAVGALGMAFGTAASSSRFSRDYGVNPDGSARAFRTMAFPVWLIWLGIGVSLSWLAAPAEPLFNAAYGMSGSALADANFGSAWMMSYVILSFAFCDALLERQLLIRKWKWRTILVSIAFIVIVLQLLRGDREAVPWVFGLALVYFHWAARITQKRGFKIPWFKVAGWGGALIVISFFVGTLRHSLVGIHNVAEVMAVIHEMLLAGQIGVSDLLYGTWSAVLLTPLSVAGDHVKGLLSFEYGSDYLGVLLSLPPGFLADAFGYVRPIDAQQGPAWEMRYGLGGTHATVLPFRNFGMSGVFLIPAVWTYLVVRYEKKAAKKISVSNLALLATLALVSPHWLWYGEKYGLNALILWWMLAGFYRVAIGIHQNTRGDGYSRVGVQHGFNPEYS